MVAASDRVFDLLVLPGDGIGPEIIGETLRVADWFGRNAGLRLNLTEGLAGGASIDAVGAPVSEAVAARHRSPETAEAEPPELPPGVRSALEDLDFQGFLTGPKAEVSFDEPMANSSMFSLPSITAPASHRFCVTVLS